MQRYIVTRVLLTIPTLLIAAFIIFAIMRLLPGDTLEARMTEYVNVNNKENLAALRKDLGLDKPFHEQFITYIGALARGDLGRSLNDGRPVTSYLAPRVPVTLELTVLAAFVSLMIAIPIGILSAIRQDSFLDYILRSAAIIGLSVPNFWLGVMAVLIPALVFGWLPPVEYTLPTENFGQHISQFLIPAFILGLFFSASLMRMTRSMMLEVLRQDYVRTAWAKGLRERVVVVRHATRNALIPVVTILGQEVAFLIGGSIVMEAIFGLPGIGLLLLDSISFRDYPLVQSIVVLMAFAIVIVNLLIDLSYAYLDPRIRYT